MQDEAILALLGNGRVSGFDLDSNVLYLNLHPNWAHTVLALFDQKPGVEVTALAGDNAMTDVTHTVTFADAAIQTDLGQLLTEEFGVMPGTR